MMVVLDTSALLAVILNEPGKEIVMPHLVGAEISVINLAEVTQSLSNTVPTRIGLRQM